jgi:hypothetical protein
MKPQFVGLPLVSFGQRLISPSFPFTRSLEELQTQLAEEKERAACSEEQQQQEVAQKEQELKAARDEHQGQLSNLQGKITQLVSENPEMALRC